MNRRLFIGIFPTGISYADKYYEAHGDYKRLAFLSYATLTLEIEPDCPEPLKQEIEEHAKAFNQGDEFQISTSGQTITLGYAINRS